MLEYLGPNENAKKTINAPQKHLPAYEYGFSEK